MRRLLLDRFLLHELTIEGFRGIKNKLFLPINSSSHIFFGPNGSGKTSILQAVEWCLFGSLKGMHGAEFEREDALVNLFHPDKEATVSLTLKAGDEIVKVYRRREQEKSTRQRKSTLEFAFGGRFYDGENAEKELRKLLCLNEDEFYSAVYLHQEDVRAFLASPLTQRSEIIDRMIGTYTLRELIDSIPIRVTSIRRSELQEHRQSLLSKITSPNMGKLEEMKNTLMKKGMKADQFGLDYLSGMVVSLNTRIREEAQTLGLTLQEIKVESKLSAIQTIAATVSSQLTTLEQAKLNSVKQLTMHLSDLKELHRRLSDAIENITSVYGVPPSEVSRELTALQIQLQEKHKQLEKLRKTIGDVGSSFALFQGVESEMERLERMVSQIGDESTIKTTLEGLEGEKKRREEEASKLDVYTKLLLLGLDYAETASTSKCPICHTSVDQNQIMNHIHAELATLQTSSEAKATKQRIEQLTEAIETARKKMVQLQSFNLQLKETSERHRKILGEIKGLIGKDNVEDVLAINFFLEGLKADAATLENSILTLRDEASKREAGMAEYNEQLKAYEKAKSEVQSLLSSNLDGRDLLSLLDREVKKAEDSLAAIDRKGVEELRTKLETISELINYHVLTEAIKDLEAEMPRKESELKSVEECLRNLEEVELSLNEIRRAAMLEQQDWVADILPKIQSSLAESFNCLTSHPLFSKLSIMVEDIRGKNVYWIAVSTEDGTKSYVQTKFSTAQLNATALAIFLTMSRYLAHNLGFIVMDDPSQSMDDAHKRSLAKFLADEINHRQVIIATQDKEFTSYLSKLTPRRLKALDVEAGNPRF